VLGKSIAAITPFTLLDYPHHSACILWYAGCNMRCLYCYNPEIVLGKGTIPFSEAHAFLLTRVGLLDAVVFSGGECLLHTNIIEQIKEVKSLGFLIKIDTNGSKPEVLKTLLAHNLIDYVALDFKATPASFATLTKSNLFSPFESSLELLVAHNLAFEIRTTVHSELIHTNELNAMIRYLHFKGYKGNYYLQSFKNEAETLSVLPPSLKVNTQDIISYPTITVVCRD